MNIYTLHGGQGHFVVVASDNEAIVIHTHVPLPPAVPLIKKHAILAGRNLVELLVTP